ncbi:Uncharacterised protein [Escherichia coli]|nr:Uncharacterised protein [Escherichia coli]
MLQNPTELYSYALNALSGINKLRLPEYSNVILIKETRPGGLPTPFRYAWGGQISRLP